MAKYSSEVIYQTLFCSTVLNKILYLELVIYYLNILRLYGNTRRTIINENNCVIRYDSKDSKYFWNFIWTFNLDWFLIWPESIEFIQIKTWKCIYFCCKKSNIMSQIFLMHVFFNLYKRKYLWFTKCRRIVAFIELVNNTYLQLYFPNYFLAIRNKPTLYIASVLNFHRNLCITKYHLQCDISIFFFISGLTKIELRESLVFKGRSWGKRAKEFWTDELVKCLPSPLPFFCPLFPTGQYVQLNEILFSIHHSNRSLSAWSQHFLRTNYYWLNLHDWIIEEKINQSKVSLY